MSRLLDGTEETLTFSPEAELDIYVRLGLTSPT